jgi:hypothetical protein
VTKCHPRFLFRKKVFESEKRGNGAHPLTVHEYEISVPGTLEVYLCCTGDPKSRNQC